jgi:hypothetical protein
MRSTKLQAKFYNDNTHAFKAIVSYDCEWFYIAGENHLKFLLLRHNKEIILKTLTCNILTGNAICIDMEYERRLTVVSDFAMTTLEQLNV